MNILCVDLEATCWEPGPPPDGQYQEIIEVGMAMVFKTDNDDWLASRFERRRFFVKPIASEISEFCYQLTGITPEMLSTGVPFRDMIEIIKGLDYSMWCSWGHWDLDMFRTECGRHNVSNPLWASSHINLKALHQLYSGRSQGLGKALQSVGLGFHGDAHRGDDDAYNVARLLKYYLDRWGLDR